MSSLLGVRSLARPHALVARPLQIEYVFLAIALVWGIAQVFIVPPLQVPDEGDHWFRASAIADGQFTADAEGMLTLPGGFEPLVVLYTGIVSDAQPLPVSLDGQAGFSGYEALFNGPRVDSVEPLAPVKVVSRVRNYSPLGYLPQAAGIGIGRLLGAQPLTCFYLARLANLLVAVALLFAAIRLAPFGKHLFAFVALLPMTMFELASVSCDALTIAGALLFIALALKASTRATLRTVDLVLLVSAATVLLNVKPGYWALVVLVLLVRPEQLGGRWRYWTMAVGCGIAVLALAAIVLVSTSSETLVAMGRSPFDQVLSVAEHPLDFLGLVLASTTHDGLRWALEGIGVLGWALIPMSPALYLAIVLGGFGFLARVHDGLNPPRRERLLLALAGLLVFLTIALLLDGYDIRTTVGLLLIQGRYLGPVVLPILLSVYGVRFASRRLGTRFVVGILLIMMLGSLETLISAYHSA